MPSLRCPIPHQSTSYRIKGVFDVRSEASPEPFMLTPGMWGGPGCGDKISEGLGCKKPDLPPCTSASEVFRCQVHLCAGSGSSPGRRRRSGKKTLSSRSGSWPETMFFPPGKLKSQVQGSLCLGGRWVRLLFLKCIVS